MEFVTKGYLDSIIGCIVDREGRIYNSYNELVGEAKTVEQLHFME